MSSLGLNASLHVELQHLAELVDRAIMEQNNARANAVPRATAELAELLREAGLRRPPHRASLLLATFAGEQSGELATLAAQLSARSDPVAAALEKLAVKLETVREEVAARMLQR